MQMEYFCLRPSWLDGHGYPNGHCKSEHSKNWIWSLYQRNRNVNSNLYIMLQMKVFQRRGMVEDTEPLVVCLLTSFLKIVIFPVFISYYCLYYGWLECQTLCFFFFSFYKLCAKWNFFLCNSSRKKNFEGFFSSSYIYRH